MRLPNCPSCGENDWIGPTNQICANCLRGLSPEEKSEIEEVLIGDLRDLVEEWRDRELHPNATEKERIMWGTVIKELEGALEE